MTETPTDLLVAGYEGIDKATKDFESLVALVRDKQVSIEGVILVTHAEDGAVSVRQTGDHRGRTGVGWGGGVGLAVGLFAPPLLASVAVGALAGGVISKFVDHRVEQEIHEKIGENLPPGSAGIIAVFDDEQRLGVEQALAGAMIRSVVQGDKKGTAALKESLAEAMGKFSPDRSALPLPDPAFGGTVGRTLDASVADWTINMAPSPPAGAPNVLLVLIDDAGFGNPSTFGGPVDTPSMTRVAEQGLAFNRFHVTALCSPTRAALLTGRNHHTVGFGSIGELPGPFPGYTASVPKDCAPFVRALQDNGYSTAGFGKWHLTPDHVQGAAGPFDRWPNAWGFDHFWGLLGRRGRPVRPRDHAGQHDARGAGPGGRRAVLPAGRSDRPSVEVAARGARTRRDEALVYLLLDRVRPRAASRDGRVEREIPRQVRPGLGCTPGGDFRTPEGARRDRPDARAHAEAGRSSRVGVTFGERENDSMHARWRFTQVSRRTRTGTSGGCLTRSRRWVSWTTRSSSTSSATTVRAWRGRSRARSTS